MSTMQMSLEAIRLIVLAAVVALAIVAGLPALLDLAAPPRP